MSRCCPLTSFLVILALGGSVCVAMCGCTADEEACYSRIETVAPDGDQGSSEPELIEESPRETVEEADVGGALPEPESVSETAGATTPAMIVAAPPLPPKSPSSSMPQTADPMREMAMRSRMAVPMTVSPSTELASTAHANTTRVPQGGGGAIPPMAETSIGPTGNDAAMETGGVEMAVELGAPIDDVVETEARAPVAEDRGDYDAVTVFYGTDRTSTATSGLPEMPHRHWLYGAGACVLLFGLLSLVSLSSSRKKTYASLAVLSFSAGSVMAIMGAIAWLQSDGAIAGPKLEYGNGRGKFVMGTCEVSIPRNHQVAELEAPSVFRLDFVEDPTKHVVLLDIEEEDSKTFFSKLRNRVEQGVSKDAFVFVHGFNVTFEDAARRTAQLAYDLKFQGAPIFYSWPSQGGLFQYAVDETNVVWTVPHLREFLRDIAKESGARSIHLIAHSMGNRALTSALRELSLDMQGRTPLFHEVVLTAPDIDAEIFRRDIAPAIVTTAKRVTLYASSNDEALVLSKQVHGYPRAGDTGEGLVVIPGIDTIDVSAVDTSLLGHNYYGDNATVISDMIDLVRNSKSANERNWLEMARLDELLYWVFRVDCAEVGAASTGTPSRF